MLIQSRHLQEALLGEFVAETLEHLSSLEKQRQNLKQNPEDTAAFDALFRVVHTIKGTCGFLDLPHLGKLAEATEEALDKLRDKKCVASTAAIDLVFLALNRTIAMLSYVHQHGREEDYDDSPLIHQLTHLADTGAMKTETPSPPAEIQTNKSPDSFLLFSAGNNIQKAVPLEQVVRLEKIEVKTIEMVGHLPAARYRGEFVPLLTLDNTLSLPDRGLAQIMLFTHDNRLVGLVVEEILDVVQAHAKPGDSISLSGQTTDIIDIAQIFSGVLEQQ